MTWNRGGLPYRMPPETGALRVAFVGQATFFEACALHGERHDVETTFIDFRAGADAGTLTASLESFSPHVVVVFRPEIIPAGLFAGLQAVTLGFLTEPLPRRLAGGDVHEDLERRRWELGHVDASNFDRVVAFDPHIVDAAAEVLAVWRSLPLPVADRFYRSVRTLADGPRPLFVGRSTEHRERMLTPAKHAHDVLHVAFGVGADRLEALFDEHDVGLNIHNEPYLSFENRVCLHLAAGHLVMSETLDPLHGLEPGIDFLEIGGPDDIAWQLELLRRFPDMHHRVRVRGRMKAELYRASRVWPRLLHDLLLDVRAFGTDRAAAAV